MRQAIILICSLLVVFNSFAVDFYENGFAFTILSESEKLCALDANVENPYSGEINIPNQVNFDGSTYTVYRVNSEAFFNCPNLTSLTVPASIKAFSIDVFRGCQSLTRLIVEDSDDVLSVGYNTYDSSGFFYGAPISYFYMGRNITLQYSKSHTNPSFKYLEEVYMSDYVTEIADGFFNGAKISKIRFSPFLKSIGSSSFNQGYKARTLILPNALTSIDANAFYGCRDIYEISLGENVKTINSYAFSECSNLTSMYVYATTPPSAAYYSFDTNYISKARLRVPSESIEQYKNSSYWKSFGEILPLNDTGTTPDTPLKFTILFPESGSITQFVKDGQILSFQIIPNNGWSLHSLTENGVEISSKLQTNGIYTTEPIHQNIELGIVFQQDTNTVINSISADKKVKVYICGNIINIDGIYTNASLYRIDGSIINTAIPNSFAIDTKGIFILIVDGISYKFAI